MAHRLSKNSTKLKTEAVAIKKMLPYYTKDPTGDPLLRHKCLAKPPARHCLPTQR